MEEQELRKKIWREAATGGLYLGLAMVASMVIRYLLRESTQAWLPGLLDFGILVGFIFTYAKRVGALYAETKGASEYSYPQSLGFVLRMMLFAGIIAGLGQFILIQNDPAYYSSLTEQTLLQSGFEQKQVDQSLEAISLMQTPVLMVISGVLSMLIYGGLIGLVVSVFVRRRPTFRPPTPPASKSHSDSETPINTSENDKR